MNRTTKRVGGCAYFTGGNTPVEKAALLPSMLERLASYEDTGLEPNEITALKVERDAAVRDLESLMGSVNSAEACCLCERDRKGCHSNFGAASCRPKWRGPQKEASGT